MSESISLAIYNCQTCMFITKNKKDYERHLQSKKHRISAFQTPNFVKDETFQKPPICSNCHKVYKSRTSVYQHMKKCSAQSPSSHDTFTQTLIPSLLTLEQIQYILIENKILKELLKNTIHNQSCNTS